GGSRYYGMFFIFFLVSIWLADYDRENALLLNKNEQAGREKIIGITIFYAILLLQVLAGIYTFREDIYRPFSQDKATVKYIQESHLDNLPIVIDGYNSGPSISAY